MAPEAAIVVNGLRKTYASKAGPTEALKGVSFDVAAGEVFGLLGPNGAGKTTLIHVLAGLALPSGGEASVLGADVVKDARRARRAIGLAGQEPDFDWWLTARESLVYHCGYHGIPRSEAVGRADALLDRFGLAEKRHAKVQHLSGGMKRRILIARAIIHDPPVVVLDEPTAGVDVELRHQLWGLVRDLKARGKTVLLTTHYLEEAEALSDRVAIISRGAIVALDAPERLVAATERDLVVLALAKALESAESLPPAVRAAYHSASEDRSTLVLQATEGGVLAAEAVQDLARAGLRVRSVSITRKRLEDAFVRLTGDAPRGGGGSP